MWRREVLEMLMKFNGDTFFWLCLIFGTVCLINFSIMLYYSCKEKNKSARAISVIGICVAVILFVAGTICYC